MNLIKSYRRVLALRDLHANSFWLTAWAVSNRMKCDLVIRALNMAIAFRKPPKGCICYTLSHMQECAVGSGQAVTSNLRRAPHTECGSQYCSHDYRRVLRQHGFAVSPSRQTVYAVPDYLTSHDFDIASEAARRIAWQVGESVFPKLKVVAEFSRVPLLGRVLKPTIEPAAARGGLGLTLLPYILGDNVPLLVRATKKMPFSDLDQWLLTHSDPRRTARIRAFMTFAEAVLHDARDDLLGSVWRDLSNAISRPICYIFARATS